MSVEAFTKFLDANPEVAKKVAACQNYNEVAKIAKANGINVTGAELTKYAAEQTAQLSDEALEAVAGGNGLPGFDPNYWEGKYIPPPTTVGPQQQDWGFLK